MTLPTSAPRPFGVSLLVVLGYLHGIISIIAGFLVLIDRRQAELISKSNFSADQLLWVGIWGMVVGVIYLLLAALLGQGSRGVRILFAIVALLNVGFGLYALVALHSEQQIAGATSMAFGLLVIYLLFNHRAEEWFEAQHGH